MTGGVNLLHSGTSLLGLESCESKEEALVYTIAGDQVQQVKRRKVAKQMGHMSTCHKGGNKTKAQGLWVILSLPEKVLAEAEESSNTEAKAETCKSHTHLLHAAMPSQRPLPYHRH